MYLTLAYRRHSYANKSSLDRDLSTNSNETPRSGKVIFYTMVYQIFIIIQRVNYKKTKTTFIYPLGTYEHATIKDSTKHAKMQTTSVKMKKIRDFKSSIENLPGAEAARKKDEPSLLHYKSDFNKTQGPTRKPFQPKQSQMCHILGDVVKSAGLSSRKDNSNKRGISTHLYNSQIVLGNDKDYMYGTHYQNNYRPTTVSVSHFYLFQKLTHVQYYER